MEMLVTTVNHAFGGDCEVDVGDRGVGGGQRGVVGGDDDGIGSHVESLVVTVV